MKTIVRITDIETHKVSLVSSVNDCKLKMDKSGYNEAIRLQDTVTIGKTVFEPIACDTAKMFEALQCLHGVVVDMLPQIGGIVLQDYERLNRGLILAREVGLKD